MKKKDKKIIDKSLRCSKCNKFNSLIFILDNCEFYLYNKCLEKNNDNKFHYHISFHEANIEESIDIKKNQKNIGKNGNEEHWVERGIKELKNTPKRDNIQSKNINRLDEENDKQVIKNQEKAQKTENQSNKTKELINKMRELYQFSVEDYPDK